MSKTELFTNLNAEFEELRKHYTHVLEEQLDIDEKESMTINNISLSARGKEEKLALLKERRFNANREMERCLTRLENLIEEYKSLAADYDKEAVFSEPLDADFSNMLYSNLLSDDELITLSRSDKMRGTLNRRALLRVMNSVAARQDNEKLRIAAAELAARYPEPQTAAQVEQLGGAMSKILVSDGKTAAAIYERAYKPAINAILSDESE